MSSSLDCSSGIAAGIVDNYDVLPDLWEEYLPGSRDSDMRVQIIGVQVRANVDI